jgi:hypothetical protein
MLARREQLLLSWAVSKGSRYCDHALGFLVGYDLDGEIHLICMDWPTQTHGTGISEDHGGPGLPDQALDGPPVLRALPARIRWGPGVQMSPDGSRREVL